MLSARIFNVPSLTKPLGMVRRLGRQMACQYGSLSREWVYYCVFASGENERVICVVLPAHFDRYDGRRFRLGAGE